MSPRGLDLEAGPKFPEAQRNAVVLGSYNKKKRLLGCSPGELGIRGSRCANSGVCLPTARRAARTRDVVRWGVCSQTGAGRGSLTCGVPGRSRSPTAGVRMRGRASAGFSTCSSRLSAARRDPSLSRASTQPPAGDSARGRWGRGRD